MTRPMMKIIPGLDNELFRYATIRKMKGDKRFKAHEEDYLQIVDRFVSFYDMELLSFLADEDTERFLNFELRVTPTYYLPFREAYAAEGWWILGHFTELAGNHYVVVETSEPTPIINSTGIQPLEDRQIDDLLEILQDEPYLRLLVRFAIATGIPPNAVDTLVLGDLDTYRGILRVHCPSRPTTNYALAPLLRVELLDYLESSRTEGHLLAPLFHCPDGYDKGKVRYNRAGHWYERVIRDILAEIDIIDPSAYGHLLSTHYDQLSKVGGSSYGRVPYRTQLAFRSAELLQEDELHKVFTPATHPRLKGCLSLVDPNYPGTPVLPLNFRSNLDRLKST